MVWILNSPLSTPLDTLAPSISSVNVRIMAVESNFEVKAILIGHLLIHAYSCMLTDVIYPAALLWCTDMVRAVEFALTLCGATCAQTA